MKGIFLFIVAIFAALFTGWVVTLVVTGIFCSGFEPNWLCSAHGGAWLWVAIISVILSLPAFVYLLLIRGQLVSTGKINNETHT